MSKKSGKPVIELRGVRQNNLKNFDLDLPLGKLLVITGLSGSGKSSLAFDTLYAEGQRRYIETFSPYARQFFDRMDKPQADRIDGIPPAIALEQKNSVKSTRSTIGTMTEICDYMKNIWPHLARLYCEKCGRVVRKDSPALVWAEVLQSAPKASEVLIVFELALSDKLPLNESLDLVRRQGYQRLVLPARATPEEENVLRDFRLAPEVTPSWETVRIEDAAEELIRQNPKSIKIVQDRISLLPANQSRFVEGCEHAYHFGKGRLSIHQLALGKVCRFSNHFHCAECDVEYQEPTPALFSFNNPVGACPLCRGFGRTIAIDYARAIPDHTLTLAGGAIKPWQIGHGLESQRDLATFCRQRGIPMDVPFEKLSPEWQTWVIEGDPDYGIDSAHEWPRAWYGLKGYFRWLESKAYKMHVRVLLARYRTYRTCAACHGKRFQPRSLLFRVDMGAGRQITLSDFYQFTIADSLDFIGSVCKQWTHRNATDPLIICLEEVASRLRFLAEAGLGYLTLDRPTRSLSGGETERVNLASCLGSRLVNTLFVLDEPSVGLHPRDTRRLITILEKLRDSGNTIAVVEHEASVMRAADQIIDLGPGHGEKGGGLVFQGTCADILKSKTSLTGEYLSGRKRASIAKNRSGSSGQELILKRATLHNLNNLTVHIPLQRLVCITGVSGSGKSTLIRDLLYPAIAARLTEDGANREPDEPVEEGGSEEMSGSSSVTGIESLGHVVLVDQSSLGRTPRSNPAVYIGAFEDIRELYASSDEARQRGLTHSSFSFNSPEGQCPTCRGAGFEKIEMQFLSDIFIRCPECKGRRYRPHILEIRLVSPAPTGASNQKAGKKRLGKSIADLLETTVDEALDFLRLFPESRYAKRAVRSLSFLQEVGLGYLRLGQPINTLSGGESQRLKLVRHLQDFVQGDKPGEKPTLFLFDEPTTGLHFDDVRVLLEALHRLVDAGHSVVVIEHNLDVIQSSDWVIDLGPDAGAAGGKIVVQGTPADVRDCAESFTGQALRAARLT